MLKSYAEVQTFIKNVMAQLGADATFAPHQEFWLTLTYQDFINGNVPDIGGAPVKLLVVGDSSQSALIHALSGKGLFSPGSRFRQMPGGGPYFTDDQIKEIAEWIDAGCPEHPVHAVANA